MQRIYLVRFCLHPAHLALLAQRLQLLLRPVLYCPDVLHGQAVPEVHPTEHLPGTARLHWLRLAPPLTYGSW
jgi:hypothetical protein